MFTRKPKEKNRRRNYFIKKKFQRNFIIKFCILVMLGALLSGAIIYTMSGSAVTTSFENSRLKIKSTADFMLPAVLLSSAVAIAVIGISTVAVTLFTSHKIAGPLYRIEKDVKEVASGNLNLKFGLRQGDEIEPLASSLESMVRSIHDRVSAMKEAVSGLEGAISSSGEVPPEVKKKLEDLKRALSKLQT